MPLSAKQMQSGSGQCDVRKRRAYITVACEKCQRRKIKCSGGQPCERCRDSDMACSYPRATRFRTARHGSVDSSQASAARTTGIKDVASSPSQTNAGSTTSSGPSNAQESSSRSAPRQLSSSVPRSLDYYIRLAESRFTAVQSLRQNTGSPTSRRPTLVGSQKLQEVVSRRNSGSSSGKMLELLEMDAWAAVLQMYDEEIGMQYPFFEMESLIRRIRITKAYQSRHDCRIEDIASLMLSLVAMLEDSATADIASPLVHDIFSAAIVRTYTSAENADKDDIYLLILTSIFFFLSDREVQAWRCIGTAMRLLHEVCHDDSGNQVVSDTLYWTVYTLDRRWSFGTGLPFAVSDADIASTRSPLLQDDQSLSSAYLKQMVAYCGISSEVRRTLLDQPHPPSNHDTACDFAHFRIVQWQNNLPKRLRFRGIDDKFDPAREKRGEYKLRLMLYLRANQMRTIILRRSAPTSSSLDPRNMDDTSSMQTMLDIAQDTIHVLVYLGRETDIYHAQHRTFNHFLETALSSLLLVCCASPTTSNNIPSCLDDVIAAIDLIRQLSQQSPITRRLHEKLKVIQQALDGLKLPGPVVQAVDGPSIDSRPDAGGGGGSTESASHDVPRSDIFNLDAQNQNQIRAEVVVPAESLSGPYQGFALYPQHAANIAPTHMPTSDFTSPYNLPSISDTSLSNMSMGEGSIPVEGNMMANLDGSLLRELNDVLMDYEHFAF